MCGGIKPSRQTAVAKEERIARAIQRASNLGANIGRDVAFPVGPKAVLIGRFGGWMRKENKAYWSVRSLGFHRVHAESFSEKGHTFPIPQTKAILVAVVKNPTTNQKEIRIVTEPAKGAVKKVHDRQPVLVAKKA